MYLRDRHSRLTFKELIIFTCGVILSGTISAVLSNAIKWGEVVLINVILFVVLAAIFFLVRSEQAIREHAESDSKILHEFANDATKRIQSLADSMGTTVKYVHELYQEPEVPYRGLPFKEIAETLLNAKREIVILGNSNYAGRSSIVSSHPTRRRYLAAIEDLLKAKERTDFTYIRVLQIPEPRDSVAAMQQVGPLTVQHCQKVLRLKQEFEARRLEEGRQGPAPQIVVMRLPTLTLDSFILIDGSLLALETTALDGEGLPYLAGALFLRGGQVIDHFRRYFTQLEHGATLMTLADFDSGAL